MEFLYATLSPVLFCFCFFFLYVSFHLANFGLLELSLFFDFGSLSALYLSFYFFDKLKGKIK